MSKLKEEREKAGYSIDYVADKLNIRRQYLFALEEGVYDELPGKIYVEGYTKMYYEFLGMDFEKNNSSDLSVVQEINHTDSDKSSLTSKHNKYIIFCSVILLILVISFYKIWQQN